MTRESANSAQACEQYLRQEARARGERLGPSRVSPKYVENDEVSHLTECFLAMFPDDEGAYCTCKDWSP